MFTAHGIVDCLFTIGTTFSGNRRCGMPIRVRKQGAEARVTFWCPKCRII